jgi:hypothetical protein
MGRAKDEWIKSQEKGWDTLGTFVCAECVEDPFLAARIDENYADEICSYCDSGTRNVQAASIEIILELIANALHFEYCDPTEGGVPFYDGEYVVSTLDTAEALSDLPLECNDVLFEAIAKAFRQIDWVPASRGDWRGKHDHEIHLLSWASFVQLVKHTSRFFFSINSYSDSSESDDPAYSELSSQQLLTMLGADLQSVGCIKRVDAQSELFRVRLKPTRIGWVPNEVEMGAPPSALATAGRMNPVGIRYLYVALEEQTALAEIMTSPPVCLVIAKYVSSRLLNVLDLTEIPEEPSVFDEANRTKRATLMFLRKFASEISKPVQKNGPEHIDYIPSQVVSEYFATVFRIPDTNQQLDGIIYNSAVSRGGKNFVIFPAKRGAEHEFTQARYVSSKEKKYSSWDELIKGLKKI